MRHAKWLLTVGLAACGAPQRSPAPAPAPVPIAAAPSAVPTRAAEPPARPAWTREYPETRREDVPEVLYGTEVHDPYRWLEDAKAPEVQRWMSAEDALTRAKLSALPERDAIGARLREVAYLDRVWIPWTRGNRIFSPKRSRTQEKWAYYWREGKSGEEKVLLDPNTWSTDGSIALHEVSVSWDGKHVAYTVSENNSDEETLHVMEVASGKVSTIDVIPGAKHTSASWSPTGDGFYYTRLPVDPSIPVDQRPGYRAGYFHRLGTDPAKDTLIAEKTGDPTTFVDTWISRDGDWLFREVGHGWRKNDIWFRPAKSHDGDWKALIVGADAQTHVTAYKGRFYVSTNDGAPKWHIYVVDPKRPERAAWREIVPERPNATLDSFRILGGALATKYLEDVTSRVELHDLDGKLLRAIALPGLGTAEISGDPDRDEMHWSFESYDRPYEIHTTSIAHGGDTRDFVLQVPFDSRAVVTEQVFVPSKDGTRVPMFVVRPRTFVRDGRAPAWVTGYGGFAVSDTPYFASSVVPWVERGGIYVFANLRGGGEYGEAWHRAGMRQSKQNVFDDFEAVADYLAREKYTSADRLVIEGASNGGLLVGAALTQRPELYRAVICGVPLLDMIRYHRFGSGRTWIEEYGSAENEEDFRALFAYSPYHHVTPSTRYPAVLVDTADSDDRVDPMHARKMAAALQAASSGGPVLLRIERNAGHGGADQLRATVDRIADHYAFALAEIRKPGGAMGN